MTQLEMECVISIDGQMPLNFTAPPLARRSDPATSHAAAQRAVTFKSKHAAQIFGALLEHPDGLTYREIAAIAQLEPVAVGRRMKELRETAGVYADGERDGMSIWKVRRA